MSLRLRNECGPPTGHDGSMGRAGKLAVTTVDEVMSRWPATIAVFIRFDMKCVGCPIAPFHSVGDACREHALAREQVLDALTGAVEKETAQASAASSATRTRR